MGALLVAVALGACSSNQRYSVSHATPSATAYPVAAAPATPYTPMPVAAAPGVSSVTFDLARTDRQSAESAALRYCADQGRTAALRSVDGYAITYDCIGGAGVVLPSAAIPSITYQNIGTDPTTLQADASRFCARQGLDAVYRSRDADRITYDCLGRSAAATNLTTTGVSGSSMPAAIPSITYETPGDNRQPAESAAIRFCSMQGLSAVLRSEEGRRVTYDCR